MMDLLAKQLLKGVEGAASSVDGQIVVADGTTGKKIAFTNKQTLSATSPITVSNTPAVIASAAPVIAIPAATTSVPGHATAAQITKLDGIEAGADVTGSHAPQSHATSHKLAGSDVILLNEFGLPTGAVAINGQQVTNLVDHIVANATERASLIAVIGKRVFQTDELAEYVCVSI